MFVIARDATTGDRLWSRSFDDVFGTALAVSPDGSQLFVTGSIESPSATTDYLTIAFAADTGQRQWRSRYRGPAGGDDDAAAIATDGARVFVTGSSAGNNLDDFATVAYDAGSGATSWVRRYDGPKRGADGADALALGGGGVIVTGPSIGVAGNFDYATIDYDAATGSRRWASRYDDRTHHADIARAVVVAPSGSDAFVTGKAGRHNATISYDLTTGDRQWVTSLRHGARATGGLDGAAITPDGATLFASSLTRVVAFDAATGAVGWVTPRSTLGQVWAIAAAPDDSGVFVTGVCCDTSSLATQALAVDTGAVLWFGALGNGVGLAIAPAPDGRDVFVTGQEDSGSEPHMVTAAYPA
jgi:outer membrane protein assembly factor BamB